MGGRAQNFQLLTRCAWKQDRADSWDLWGNHVRPIRILAYMDPFNKYFCISTLGGAGGEMKGAGLCRQ